METVLVIEVMQELHRIDEKRNGAVYRTSYVRNVWVSKDNLTPPKGYIYVTPSGPGAFIRSVRRVA